METIFVWVLVIMPMNSGENTPVTLMDDLADKASCVAIKREVDKQYGISTSCVPVKRIVYRR